VELSRRARIESNPPLTYVCLVVTQPVARAIDMCVWWLLLSLWRVSM